MSAASLLLEIPEVRSRVSPVTVEQYHQFPEFNENGRRTELIRGIAIEKMSKSPLHTSIGSALYDLLHPQVPQGCWLRKKEPLTLRDSEPEPDLSLVRGTRRDFVEHHPGTAALVVEIAVSSAAEDRVLASLYAEAGVEEYGSFSPSSIVSKSIGSPGMVLTSIVLQSPVIPLLPAGPFRPFASDWRTYFYN